MLILELALLLFSIVLTGIALFAIRKNTGGRGGELDSLRAEISRIENACSDGFQTNRRELGENLASGRIELGNSFRNLSEANSKSLADFSASLREFRTAMEEQSKKGRTETFELQSKMQAVTELRLAQIRDTVDLKLKEIQEQNAKKLEEMRKVVDEKLQESVDKHFNESFKLIGERLELVQKGLGEMQNLAAGVGDLKKVLTNVKSRGNMGEIRLAAILEEYLTADQYVTNTATVPNSRELVEFAIRMPGKTDSEPVLLPVDSKFPVEDYQRLLNAYENDSRLSEEVKKAQAAFETAVRKCAKDIRTKYVSPPYTTEFALLFVPSEGLYAEVLRLPGLFEKLQREFRITVVGPSTLVAFLNSLQMGFRTLAIEKRSAEVWNILATVKTQFRKFGEEMDSTRKSLQSVVNHVDSIGIRSRALEKSLSRVQELPSGEPQDQIPEQEERGGETLPS